MQRCQSVEGRLEFYQQYHDYEWGRPQQKEQKLFEILGLKMFQAGLSFEIILKNALIFAMHLKTLIFKQLLIIPKHK